MTAATAARTRALLVFGDAGPKPSWRSPSVWGERCCVIPPYRKRYDRLVWKQETQQKREEKRGAGVDHHGRWILLLQCVLFFDGGGENISDVIKRWIV